MFRIKRRKGHLGGAAPCLQSVLSTSVLLSRAHQTRPARLWEMLRGGCVVFCFVCLFVCLVLRGGGVCTSCGVVLVKERTQAVGVTFIF